MTFIPKVEFHEIDTVVVLVTAIEQGCLSIRATMKVMKPLQTSRQITPTNIDHILQGCAVIAREETEEELVTRCHRPVYFRIDIVKIECVVLEVLA